MTDIDQLIRDGRELLDKATPGPWEHIHIFAGEELIRADLDRADAPVIGWWHDYDDGRFSAWSRNNLPQLLGALEAAQMENERLKRMEDKLWAMESVLQLRDQYEAEADALRAELLAAREVCEAVADYTQPDVPMIAAAKFEALTETLATYRATRGGT